MKTLISLAVALFGLSAQADFRKIHIEDSDAQYLQNAFLGVSTENTVASPLTGGSIMEMTTFLSDPFNLKCKVHMGFFSQKYDCDLEIDPLKSTNQVEVKPEGDHSLRIDLKNPDVVASIRRRISGDFESQTRALGDSLPLLRISCVQDVCSIFVAN
jgi:hypothetical protein